MSRQAYYRSFWSVEIKTDVAQKVIDLVGNIRKRMPKIGCLKLYHILKKPLQELGVGRDKLFLILRNNQLLNFPKRRYHVTTNSHHRFKKHKNLIEHLFIERAEQVWVSDITYIGTSAHPMYLALVTDAYSKKVVGYDVSTSLELKVGEAKR